MKPLAGLAVWLIGSAVAASEPEAQPFCKSVEFRAQTFTVCEADATRDDIRIFLNGTNGQPLGHFSRLSNILDASGKTLLFAMNGGMYHPDRSPVGHYVEDGREMMRVIEGAGPGNFGMVPNGIFCVAADSAKVIETETYVRDRPDCRFATQSGPMLVIDGELHPRFLPQSDSRYIRNGVGTSADGTHVVFAKSEGVVNFHDFASLFRDHLGLPSALYLDGNISRLFDAGAGRDDPGFRMGPIIAIVGASK